MFWVQVEPQVNMRNQIWEVGYQRQRVNEWQHMETFDFVEHDPPAFEPFSPDQRKYNTSIEGQCSHMKQKTNGSSSKTPSLLAELGEVWENIRSSLSGNTYQQYRICLVCVCVFKVQCIIYIFIAAMATSSFLHNYISNPTTSFNF